MKTGIILLVTVAAFASSCATPPSVYQSARQLAYEERPSDQIILSQMTSMIRPALKDPDSLKNLRISNAYKCYASNMSFTDNVTPKYAYGYWCYHFEYQATNSYGGYVKGNDFAVFYKGRLRRINQIGETVRKADDVNTYVSPGAP